MNKLNYKVMGFLLGLLLLISAAIVHMIVPEKETEMNLTFEPDFELLYLNKERYNHFRETIDQTLSNDSALHRYVSNLTAALDDVDDLDERLIRYLNRLNSNVPNYNAEDDVEMFKETVRANLEQYAKNRQVSRL